MYKILKLLNNKQIKTLVFVLFLMLCVAALETFSIGAVLPLLSTFTNQSTELEFLNNFLNHFRNNDNQKNLIIFSSVIIIFSFCTKNIFIYLYTRVVSSFLGHLSLDWQRKIFENYVDTNYANIKDKNTSEIMRDIQIESKLIVGQFISPTLTIIQNVLVISFVTIFLLFYDFKITMLITLFLLILLLIFIKIFKKKLNIFGLQRQILNTGIIESIKETFDGLRELKIYRKKSLFLEKFVNKSIKFTNMGVRRTVISVVPKIYTETIVIIMIMTFIIVSTIYDNSFSKIFAYVSLYAVAGFRLLPIFLSLINNYQKINYTESAVDLVSKLLDQNNKSESIENLKDQKFNKEIKLLNVSFSYKSEIDVLKNTNLTIKKNTFTGIYGESGSGKSTFVDLLIGLIKPQTGKICLDGKDINNFDESYLKLFSYVQQNVHLFNNSLLQNITFTNDISKVDLDKLNYVLEFCLLNNLVDEQADGVNMQIGEFGKSVSGGQLQRIGLARALYKDSDIIILDEPLSNLDQKNKEEILNRIIKLKSNKTIIYISHDINDLKKCDNIIEFKKV